MRTFKKYTINIAGVAGTLKASNLREVPFKLDKDTNHAGNSRVQWYMVFLEQFVFTHNLIL